MRLDANGNPLEEEEVKKKKKVSAKPTLVEETAVALEKEQIAKESDPAVHQLRAAQGEYEAYEKGKVEGRDELQSKIDDNQKQQSTLGDQFKNAMTYFAPQIIGGLIGGAFEGTEGALGGLQAGGEIRDKMVKHQLEGQKLNKQKAFQQTDFFDEETKEPLTFDPKKGTYRTAAGREVASLKVKSGLEMRHLNNMRERQDSRQQKLSASRRSEFDNFSKASKKNIDSIVTIEPMINLLKSGRRVTDDFLSPFIAKGIQKEVGNLSETDLRNARVPEALIPRWKNTINEFFDGDMSGEHKQTVIDVLQYVTEQDRQIIQQRSGVMATKFLADSLDMDQEELQNQYLRRTGIEFRTGQSAATIEDKKHFPLPKGKERIKINPKNGLKYRWNTKTGKYSRIKGQ